MDKGFEEFGVEFPAGDEAAEVVQPADGPFDFVAATESFHHTTILVGKVHSTGTESALRAGASTTVGSIFGDRAFLQSGKCVQRL